MKNAQIDELDRHWPVSGRAFIFDPDAPSASLNVIALATDDESREWLVRTFEQMAQVELTDERRQGYQDVLKSLPAGAKLTDFFAAAKTYEAEILGVSLLEREALAPFIEACGKLTSAMGYKKQGQSRR